MHKFTKRSSGPNLFVNINFKEMVLKVILCMIQICITYDKITLIKKALYLPRLTVSNSVDIVV